jgi:hypothetical protein
MQYLVQMKLVPQGRPTTPEEGTAFIDQYIFPTLELCKHCKTKRRFWQADRRAAQVDSC